jgi:hypothetical protein
MLLKITFQDFLDERLFKNTTNSKIRIIRRMLLGELLTIELIINSKWRR